MPVKDGRTDRKLYNRRKSRKFPIELIVEDLDLKETGGNVPTGTPIARRLRSNNPKPVKLAQSSEQVVDNKKSVAPGLISNGINGTNGHHGSVTNGDVSEHHVNGQTNGFKEHEPMDSDESESDEKKDLQLTDKTVVKNEVKLAGDTAPNQYCVIL